MTRYLENKYREPSLDEQKSVLMSPQFIAATSSLLPLFPSPEKAWQPSDRIPSLAELIDKPRELEERLQAANGVPDHIIVCLIGNEVTEAVLGNYTRELERTFPQTEKTADHPFHTFGRYWAAEEQRHGTVLDRYLNFCKKINLRKVEETIHHLNRAGFDTRSGSSIYQGIVYPRFQEELTAIAHINVGKNGQDPFLLDICGSVTGDENRHKRAYQTLVSTLMSLDPTGMTAAIGNIVRKGIVMPAELMNTPEEPKLFQKFSLIAAKERILSPEDMLKVHQGAMGSGTNGLNIAEQRYEGKFKEEAEQAREFLLTDYPRIIKRAADRYASPGKLPEYNFSWLKNN